jgi:hypothetical protein
MIIHSGNYQVLNSMIAAVESAEIHAYYQREFKQGEVPLVIPHSDSGIVSPNDPAFIADLGGALERHDQLMAELNPHTEACEVNRSEHDPTGQNAIQCGANARYRAELEMHVCDWCYRQMGGGR